MAKENLTKSANIDVAARQIDFVTNDAEAREKYKIPEIHLKYAYELETEKNNITNFAN